LFSIPAASHFAVPKLRVDQPIQNSILTRLHCRNTVHEELSQQRGHQWYAVVPLGIFFEKPPFLTTRSEQLLCWVSLDARLKKERAPLSDATVLVLKVLPYFGEGTTVQYSLATQVGNEAREFVSVLSISDGHYHIHDQEKDL
jgi:hypothetical protein